MQRITQRFQEFLDREEELIARNVRGEKQASRALHELEDLLRDMDVPLPKPPVEEVEVVEEVQPVEEKVYDVELEITRQEQASAEYRVKELELEIERLRFRLATRPVPRQKFVPWDMIYDDFKRFANACSVGLAAKMITMESDNLGKRTLKETAGILHMDTAMRIATFFATAKDTSKKKKCFSRRKKVEQDEIETHIHFDDVRHLDVFPMKPLVPDIFSIVFYGWQFPPVAFSFTTKESLRAVTLVASAGCRDATGRVLTCTNFIGKELTRDYGSQEGLRVALTQTCYTVAAMIERAISHSEASSGQYDISRVDPPQFTKSGRYDVSRPHNE